MLCALRDDHLDGSGFHDDGVGLCSYGRLWKSWREVREESKCSMDEEEDIMGMRMSMPGYVDF